MLASYAEPGQLPHPVLRSAHGALSAHYAPELDEPFAGTGLCLYRDGRDSMAWHGDTLGRGATTDTIVAIVSFGSTSRAAATPPRRRTRLRYALGHGDLLVMGGSCQRAWEHAVPKSASVAGPRVSVQFRPAGVA